MRRIVRRRKVRERQAQARRRLGHDARRVGLRVGERVGGCVGRRNDARRGAGRRSRRELRLLPN